MTMDWIRSKEWLHDMVHYMPRGQIEYIIGELVEHGDVTRTEPDKPTRPSILDEEWHVEGDTGIANKHDEHILSVNGHTEMVCYFVDIIAALPDLCRALKGIRDNAKMAAHIDSYTIHDLIMDRVFAALQKAGVE